MQWAISTVLHIIILLAAGAILILARRLFEAVSELFELLREVRSEWVRQHKVRTPIAEIVGISSTLLKTGIELKPETRRTIEIINDIGTRAISDFDKLDEEQS